VPSHESGSVHHHFTVVRDLLPLGGFPEHVEGFVEDQVEVVLRAGPLLRVDFILCWILDDVLPEEETDVEELLEDARGDGDVVAVLAGVPDEDRAGLAWLEDAVGLGGDLGSPSSFCGHSGSATFMV